MIPQAGTKKKNNKIKGSKTKGSAACNSSFVNLISKSKQIHVTVYEHTYQFQLSFLLETITKG